MEGKELEHFLKYRDELNEALATKVKLSWQEVLKIVVKDLIKKRNHARDEQPHFDKVLLYYLGDADFNKYVINGKKIK